MGLSIHYRGTIKDMTLIPKLVEELIDISSVFHWDRYVFDDNRAKGICLSPADCEPVIVAFTPDGKLCSPFELYHSINPSTWISVKTQYAGIGVHEAVIKLLKYLNQNYFSEFEMHDEGRYWETDNENVLQKRFDEYKLALGTLYKALNGLEPKPNETSEALADRLEKFLKEKFGK